MSLADQLREPPTAKRINRCAVGRWIDSLSPEDRDATNSAIENREWQAQPLHRVLVANGLIAGHTTFRKHRDKECACV